MTKPRHLADHNLHEAIVEGVLHAEPAVEFVLLRAVKLSTAPDEEVLAFADESGYIVVTHDIKTMPPAAMKRMARGQIMRGVFIVPHDPPIGPIVRDLLLIWGASAAEEWIGRVVHLPL